MSDIIKGPVDEFEELTTLISINGGRVTAEQIVATAANPASTFHKHFLWDDTEAARRFRLQQAGALIRKFTIVRPSGDRTIRVPAFVKVNDGADGYAPTQDVVTFTNLRDQYKVRLIGTLERIVEELRNWDEFVELADLIESTLSAEAA